MRPPLATAVVAVLLIAGPAFAQPPASSPTPQAQAYYEFMLARRLESDGDTAGALAALARAEKLDPSAADIPAEMAGLHARQNDGEEARAAAERALKLDPDNVEAHRILGLVYAAWADGAGSPPTGVPRETLRATAIEHLQAIRRTPAMATDLSLQLALGRQLLRAGQTDDAIAVLDDLASQAPYLAEPFVLIAEARTAQGNMDDAAEALARAARVNPRYYVSLGDMYERMGEWAAAAGAYERGLEGVRAPSRDLRLRYVSALLNVPGGAGAGRARDTLRELLERNPKDTRLLYLMSTAHRQLRDFAAAEASAREMLAVDPTSLAGLSALARVLSDQYKYREVVDLLSPLARDAAARAKGREGEAAGVLIQLGFAELQLADYDGALAAFTAAKTMGQDPANDLYVIQAQISARRFEQAATAAEQALARLPREPRLLRLRAEALAGLNRGADAIRLLEEAAQGSPRSPQLAVALANAYAAEQRYEEAVRVLEQAETALGETEEITLGLVTIYEEAGRLAEAERELRARIEADPLDATALNYLGYLLADRTDRFGEAVDLIERALKVEPENPSFLDSLGWALFKQGRVRESLVPLEKAATALPANSVIQDHYGDALAREGRWSDAEAAWERALAGDGESIDRAAVTKKLDDARRRR